MYTEGHDPAYHKKDGKSDEDDNDGKDTAFLIDIYRRIISEEIAKSIQLEDELKELKAAQVVDKDRFTFALDRALNKISKKYGLDEDVRKEILESVEKLSQEYLGIPV